MAIEGITKSLETPLDAERRRAGRLVAASPHLISLLRSPLPSIETKLKTDPISFGTDQLAPARGIVVSVVISAVIWLGLLAALGAFL